MCRLMKRVPVVMPLRRGITAYRVSRTEKTSKKCFPLTVDMMGCMQKHDYYDIMTANSQAKMAQLNAADQSNAKMASD